MARTTAATTAHMHNAAIRAAEDPQALSKAVRIVRVGLETRKLSIAEFIDSAPAVSPEHMERLRALLPPVEQDGGGRVDP